MIRTTSVTLQRQVNSINHAYGDVIYLENRNNYYAIDSYDQSACYNVGMTAKECSEYLFGMSKGFELAMEQVSKLCTRKAD